RSQPLAVNKPIRTYTVPLQMQDLDGVTSPAELLTRIRRQPVMTVDRVRSEELGARSYLYSGSPPNFQCFE
ncbi:MAG: hypothetical protein FWH27_15275, partial [Planctomycetaceae bacterium]|nr:hypothetical protein [Planctomycetaceae bacterium]